MKFLHLVLLGLLVFAFSCKSDDFTATDQIDEAYSAMPSTTVKNGILHFNSFADLKNAYAIIASSLEEIEDQDAVLRGYVNYFGHDALYQRNDLSLREDEGYTTEEILALMKEDFIADDVRKVLLNQFYEVGVAGDTYVIIAPNKNYRIIGSESTSVELLRGSNKGAFAKSPLGSLTEFVEFVPEKNSGENTVVTGGGIDDAGTRSSSFILTAGNEPVECQPLQKIIYGSLYNFTNSTTQAGHPGQWTIDFGDGTEENFFFDNYSENLNGWSMTHTYGSPGTYEVTVIVVYDDEFGNSITDQTTFEAATGGDCSGIERDRTQWNQNDEDYDGSTRGMGSKIWFKDDFFGTHAGAYTTSWEWRQNRARWRKNRFNAVEVTIFGIFRDNDTCEEEVTKEGSDDCNSCHKKRILRTSLASSYSMETGDIQSTHQVNLNGLGTIDNEMVLDTCN